MCIKKRRLRYCLSTHKGLSTYPFSQTNNNETYADMTNHPPRNDRVGMNVIPVGAQSFTLLLTMNYVKSVLSFLGANNKASINAFQYVTDSMFVLMPWSGNSSGAALDMRSVAYLHPLTLLLMAGTA